MFIPVQVLLDKLIISSMSIHPGILISVSMPAHQMSKLRFPSLLQELKYLPIPPFFLSGQLHLFHQFSDYIAILPDPVFRHAVFPVFPLSLSFLLSFSRVFLQVLSLLFLFPDQPHLLPVLLLLCYHIHLLYKCPLLTNPDYIGDSQSFSQNRSSITVTAILYFTSISIFCYLC